MCRARDACARRLTLLLALGLAACAASGAEERRWVHKIGFRGIKHISERDLRKHIALEQTSWIPFTKKKYIDPFTLGMDRKRIEAYYADRGYYSARVVSAEVKDHDSQSVDVRITVQEGLPVKIDQVTVTGLDALGSQGDKVRRIFKLNQGQVFNHLDYMAQKDAMEAQLKVLGHAWAKVEGTVEVNRESHLADVKLAADPGPRATFGKVEVHGTSKVNPRLVALHSGIEPGRPFDPLLVEDAKGKLYNLGVFSSVRVEYQHDPARPDIADVLITVNEGTFHELRLGGGIGFESQRNEVHLQAIYTQRNFLGGLRTLQASLKPGWVVLPAIWQVDQHGPMVNAEVQFTQPDVLWRFSDLKATVGFDVGTEYAYQYLGPRTQLGLSWPLWRERLRLGISHNFQYLYFFNAAQAITQDPTEAGRLYGYQQPYQLGWWQQDISLDLRDRPLDARRGGYFAVSAEEGGIYAGGAFNYQKLAPEARGYLPLGSRVVVAARMMFGEIFTQGELGSPITRRFYLGGPNSHRGFNYNRLSLQAPTCQHPLLYGALYKTHPDFTRDRPGSPDFCYDNMAPGPGQNARGTFPTLLPIGGDEMFLAQAELRVNLFQLYGYWLSAAAFVDAGDVGAPSTSSLADLAQRIDFTNLHWATGGGLRYNTIIGTLRLDLGVRLNRLDDYLVLGSGPRDPTCTNPKPELCPAGLLFRANPDPGQRFAFHISIGEAF